MSEKRIGIFSGSFDPVHLGHLQFALQSIKKLKLDEVYFLPERLPRKKQPVHFAHRLAMIKLAIKPYPELKVMELPERQFSVNKTLPQIMKLLGPADIFFLFGSDKAGSITSWPNYEQFLDTISIVLCPTKDHAKADVNRLTKVWPKPPFILSSNQQMDISSGKIRKALTSGKLARGLLKSTDQYIKENWLYISLDIQS